MPTKREHVEAAYEELAMAGYVFDLDPEELQSGLRRLDNMLALWDGEGITLGYNTASDLDTESNVPAWAIEAVELGLAVRIAASKGKILARTTQAGAKTARDVIVMRLAREQVQPQQLRSDMPRGAGYKSRRSPFLPPPTHAAPLEVDGVGNLALNE